MILFPPWFRDRSQRPSVDPFQVEKPKWTAGLDINLESLDYSDLNTIVTKAAHQKKTGKRSLDYYGFCTYSGFHSKPLLGMIYQESVKIIDNVAVQISLSKIGMFSVIEELSLYSDDAQMKALEDSLNKAITGPFGANYELVEYLWNNLNGEGS